MKLTGLNRWSKNWKWWCWALILRATYHNVGHAKYGIDKDPKHKSTKQTRKQIVPASKNKAISSIRLFTLAENQKAIIQNLFSKKCKNIYIEHGCHLSEMIIAMWSKNTCRRPLDQQNSLSIIAGYWYVAKRGAVRRERVSLVILWTSIERD